MAPKTTQTKKRWIEELGDCELDDKQIRIMDSVLDHLIHDGISEELVRRKVKGLFNRNVWRISRERLKHAPKGRWVQRFPYQDDRDGEFQLSPSSYARICVQGNRILRLLLSGEEIEFCVSVIFEVQSPHPTIRHPSAVVTRVRTFPRSEKT